MTDERDIADALAVSDRAAAATVTGDAAAFAAAHSSDCVVNSPANRVLTAAMAEAAFAHGMIAYHALDRRIEHSGKLAPDMVVVMGEEVARPRGNAAHAGKTVRRRFTDVLRRDADGWKIAARQATIISIED